MIATYRNSPAYFAAVTNARRENNAKRFRVGTLENVSCPPVSIKRDRPTVSR